jgi:2-dehydropantoate 2-reductase
MRYVIYGAGAVGGLIGGRLAQAGREAILIARGSHLDAIKRDGLRMVVADGDYRFQIPAVEHPREIAFRRDDVVILTMKTQDTEAALHDLESAGGGDLPIVCCQNGVDNERIAARRFERVYGMVVYLWATFLEAGTVIGNTAPASGVLDAGCYPSGVDGLITEIAADLSDSHFVSRPRPDIMSFKYAKMLGNLGTAIPAITEDAIGSEPQRRLTARLRAEAIACYAAAGITIPSEAQLEAEIAPHNQRHRIEGMPWGEGSTWQSIARGRDSVESDYLNGEIVLLGHLHGVPTPLNSAVRRLTNQIATARQKPGGYTIADIERFAEQHSAAVSPS